jgi:hypothetical protein
MSRILRCSACTKRIKPHHAHIGVEDLATDKEFFYHARCAEAAAAETAARLARGGGKVHVIHHYHSSTCPDERPGFRCSGGCFDTVAEAN